MLSPNALFTANINVQHSAARSTSKQAINDAKSNKSKGGMLSAWNRKKNKNLPAREESAAGSLTASPDGESQSPFNSRESQLTSSARSSLIANSVGSPQLDSFADARKSSSSSQSSRLRPRSGRPEDAENTIDLCNFLNENRIQPSDAANTISTPKSTFEWDSDEEASKPSKVSIPRLKKHVKAAVAVGAGRSDVGILEVHEEVAKAEKVMKQLGAMLLAPQSPGGSRANAFKEQPDLLDLAAPRNEVPDGRAKATHVTSPLAAQVAAFSRETAVKRSSVLKLFNDPIWGGDSGKYSHATYKIYMKCILIGRSSHQL